LDGRSSVCRTIAATFRQRIGEANMVSLYTKPHGPTRIDSIEITQLSVIDLD
jgi:hypothetical protein